MDLKILGWMTGEGCDEVDWNMDLSFPASVRRPVNVDVRIAEVNYMRGRTHL